MTSRAVYRVFDLESLHIRMQNELQKSQQSDDTFCEIISNILDILLWAFHKRKQLESISNHDPSMILSYFIEQEIPHIILEYYEKQRSFHQLSHSVQTCILKTMHYIFYNIPKDDPMLKSIMFMRNGAFLNELVQSSFDTRIDDIANWFTVLLKTLSSILNPFLSLYYFCQHTYNIPVLTASLELVCHYDSMIMTSCRQTILNIFSKIDQACLMAYYDSYSNTLFLHLWRLLTSWLSTMTSTSNYHQLYDIDTLFSEHCDILLFLVDLFSILQDRKNKKDENVMYSFETILKDILNDFGRVVDKYYLVNNLTQFNDIEYYLRMWALVHLTRIVLIRFHSITPLNRLVQYGSRLLTIKYTDSDLLLLLFTDTLIDCSECIRSVDQDTYSFFFHVYTRISHESTEPLKDVIHEKISISIEESYNSSLFQSSKLYQIIYTIIENSKNQ